VTTVYTRDCRGAYRGLRLKAPIC